MKKSGILLLTIALLLMFATIFLLIKENKDISFEHYFDEAKITIAYNVIPFDTTKEELFLKIQNHPIYFTTSKDLLIDGSHLKAGSYSLWIERKSSSWKIIFNTSPKNYFSFQSNSRKTIADYLKVEVPIIPLLDKSNQLSVYFKNANGFTLMYIQADDVSVALPISIN